MQSVKLRNLLPMILLAFLGLSGCSTLKGSPEPLFNKEELIKITAYDASKLEDIQATTTEKDRNTKILKAMSGIDIRYGYYTQDLMSDRANIQSLFSLAILSMNAAGASVASVAAKTNYALSSATVAGAQEVIDKNFFYDKTVTALISAMDAARASKFLEIKRKLTLSIEQYSGNDALADIRAYEGAGSLRSAINQITTTSNAAATADTQKAANIEIPTDKMIARARKVRETILNLDDSDLPKLNKLLTSLGLTAQPNMPAAKKEFNNYYRTGQAGLDFDGFMKNYTGAGFAEPVIK